MLQEFIYERYGGDVVGVVLVDPIARAIETVADAASKGGALPGPLVKVRR